MTEKEMGEGGPVGVTTRTIFFIMVHHLNGWIRVGQPYPTPEAAKDWVPFVRKAWRGLKTKVEPCKLSFLNGVITAESRQLLDQKFNVEA